MPPRRPNALSRRQRLAYGLARVACRFVQVQSVRLQVTSLPVLPAEGCVLAVTHLSHLEPVAVGLILRRPIRWMARAEFYRYAAIRAVIDLLGGFKVDRFGVPVSAIRTSIETVEVGGIVGMFPEGGVKVGDEAAIRGGRVKRGVCLIAQRTGRPVVPVVVLGTDRLLRPLAYLPIRRTRVWVAFGEPIHPWRDVSRDGPTRRAGRAALAAEIESAFRDLYRGLLDAHGLDDADFP